jgi:hypothetical protein
MSTMITEVYDALVAAGSPDDKARAAAKVLADYDKDFADIKSTQRLRSWILTLHTGMLVAILWRVFSH